MKYHQRDIVEINFLLPTGDFKIHPAIIVSNDELQEDEGFIYLCMISSKDYNDKYFYKLTDEMTTNKFDKQSYVKCQIIVSDIESGVYRKIGQVKQPYFSEIVEKIKESIF